NLSFGAVGLPPLIKSHDYGRRTVSSNHPSAAFENLLALLQADGIRDAFPLDAFQSSLDDRPFRAVGHDRNSRNVRLGCDQVEKASARRLSIQQTFIHTHIDDLCATVDLFSRNAYCFFVL